MRHSSRSTTMFKTILDANSELMSIFPLGRCMGSTYSNSHSGIPVEVRNHGSLVITNQIVLNTDGDRVACLRCPSVTNHLAVSMTLSFRLDSDVNGRELFILYN
jgi:hypothetical protein